MVDVNTSYKQSFGTLPDETVFQDPLGFRGVETDLTKELNNQAVQLKAMTTDSGNGGTDKVLIPLSLDPRIVNLTRKHTPLVAMFPRVSNKGINANFNVISASQGAAFELEDATLTDKDDTYQRRSVDIKFLYITGRTTGQAQAATPGFKIEGANYSGSNPFTGFTNANAPNANSLNIINKSREMKKAEEKAIVAGDATANAKEFSGIIKTMGTTNTVDKGNTAITLDDIDKAASLAFKRGGAPGIAVCDVATYLDIKKILQTKIGFLSSEEKVIFGNRYLSVRTMVGSITIIPSVFMSENAGAKAMYLLDMSVWEMRVLQDLTMEQLAKTNDSNRFFLKIYEALICRAVEFNSSITKIA
jgi:hypothetical protein